MGVPRRPGKIAFNLVHVGSDLSYIAFVGSPVDVFVWIGAISTVLLGSSCSSFSLPFSFISGFGIRMGCSSSLAADSLQARTKLSKSRLIHNPSVGFARQLTTFERRSLDIGMLRNRASSASGKIKLVVSPRSRSR